MYRNVFNTKVEETFDFKIALAIQFEPKLTAVHHKNFAIWLVGRRTPYKMVHA